MRLTTSQLIALAVIVALALTTVTLAIAHTVTPAIDIVHVHPGANP